MEVLYSMVTTHFNITCPIEINDLLYVLRVYKLYIVNVLTASKHRIGEFMM